MIFSTCQSINLLILILKDIPSTYVSHQIISISIDIRIVTSPPFFLSFFDSFSFWSDLILSYPILTYSNLFYSILSYPILFYSLFYASTSQFFVDSSYLNVPTVTGMSMKKADPLNDNVYAVHCVPFFINVTNKVIAEIDIHSLYSLCT